MEERPATPDVSVTVEGLLNYHWLSLLETSEERERLGLKYLSLGHGGYPFWSVWFSDVLGVYRLELLGAREASGYDWLAEIKLKYYPTPEEACFAGLSMYEQACRIGATFRGRPAARRTGDTGCACHRGAGDASSEERFTDLVDGAGVPNPAYQDRLPDDFFFAGGLLLAFRRGEGTRIRWQSQDRWRVRLTSDCSSLWGRWTDAVDAMQGERRSGLSRLFSDGSCGSPISGGLVSVPRVQRTHGSPMRDGRSRVLQRRADAGVCARRRRPPDRRGGGMPEGRHRKAPGITVLMAEDRQTYKQEGA